MSVQLPLDRMNTAEKLAAMEALWEDLSRNAPTVAVPEWHREALMVREAEVQAGVEVFSDWEQAKEAIRATVKNLLSPRQ